MVSVVVFLTFYEFMTIKEEIICKCRCKCRVKIVDKLCKCISRFNECFHIIAVKKAIGRENEVRKMKSQNLVESKRGILRERKGGKKFSRTMDYTPKKRKLENVLNVDCEVDLNQPKKRKIALPYFLAGKK